MIVTYLFGRHTFVLCWMLFFHAKVISRYLGPFQLWDYDLVGAARILGCISNSLNGGGVFKLALYPQHMRVQRSQEAPGSRWK